jgi:hypothetical protein
MTAGFTAIFDDLLERHRPVSGELGPAHVAIVRQASALLASDEVSAADARSATALLSMLPGQPDEADLAPDQWDLSRLSDAELHVLQDTLQSIGARCQTSEPQPAFGDRLAASYRAHERTLSELTSEREMRWQAENSMHAARSELARVEQELSRHRSALQEVAKALAESEAKAGKVAGEDASTASARGPGGSVNVVPMRKLSPQESSDCLPCYAPAERFHPDQPA